MRRPRRRTLGILCACLILLAAGVVTAVRWAQSSKVEVTLLASWDDEEQERFQRRVLDEFERRHPGIDVRYEGSSALSQVLAADLAAGTPPDVAVLPGPGELMEYAAKGELKSLDNLFKASDYDSVWTPQLVRPGHGKHTYWLPIKASLKSMVWYPAGWSKDRVAEPREWCLAMESGATSGWPGTDWVEDVLLQQAGQEQYEKWATGALPWTHEDVQKAWTTWGDMVGAGGGHITSELKASYKRQCKSIEHQGSYRETEGKTDSRTHKHSADVIPKARPAAPWVISGDLVALLTTKKEAKELIRYLADPGTKLPDFTVNKPASADRYPQKGSTGWTLRGEGSPLCWDASDAMPPTLRNAFQQTVIRFLLHPEDLKDQLESLEKLRDGQPSTLRICDSG
ncbi:hypothetical protein SGFS_026390 [Streptomyces graminofaciens]|uniref:Extracellular solute-binding protein n=1 Tax=Streptomyces graminofaciens TaxID=68212 RepID=A0ABM7F664_9ACTN|nr:ABC transporter substrate-binding protein [Streptomyces graminofaciens]BBC31345.1 hypothetical protein SGFS_026390 [Streptomyces graminofaciens]